MRHCVWILGSVVLATVLLAGCASEPTYQGLDRNRLLHMAGEEAGQIPSLPERLKRQLNIADRETNNSRMDNARSTLLEARKTLESAKPVDLSDLQRLSGWISISELSRNARDVAAANSALDVAIAKLQAIVPTYARCEFVHGVAREINALRGQKASAQFIASAGEWAQELPDQLKRRAALLSFAGELFWCDEYEAARRMLQYEPDAAWRCDTLMALAQPNLSMTQQIIGPLPQQLQFGSQLDFKSNYQGK